MFRRGRLWSHFPCNGKLPTRSRQTPDEKERSVETAERTQKILDRTNIVSFIQEFVPLTKAGARWKGLCPFHTEKTPSFMVNPERQIFHCFECGKGGSAIAFLMERQRISFPEAVNHLGDRVGIHAAT